MACDSMKKQKYTYTKIHPIFHFEHYPLNFFEFSKIQNGGYNGFGRTDFQI